MNTCFEFCDSLVSSLMLLTYASPYVGSAPSVIAPPRMDVVSCYIFIISIFPIFMNFFRGISKC